MVFSKPLCNGTTSTIIRYVTVAVVSFLIATAGWTFGEVRDCHKIFFTNVAAQTTEVRVDARFDSMDDKLNESISRIERKIDAGFERITERIDSMKE